ncbi:MAG TPA: hypothetical protein VNT26_09825, partial [Candidatus Sulfotelmatobacter sp.]|nr:hypothetical protein [Candidatus Sulfotelmatobacter sp.]
GNGKVARLPKTLRDQVSQMILDGLPYTQIIQALGEAGKALNEDNIGNWKNGGYRDWLLDLQRAQALRATREAALDLLTQQAGVPVQDAGRTIAAAQLYELLLSFDPSSFAAALADKPELYLRLVNALSRLSEGEANCSHRRTQDSLLAAKLNPAPSANNSGSAALSPETLKEIARQLKLL